MNKLYLFDFDGTLTKQDTLFDFLKFSFPTSYKYAYLKFLPLFIMAKIKIVKTAKIKEKFIAYFLKGKSRNEIEKLAQKYFTAKKNILLRPKAIDFIQDLKTDTDKYIVTASLDIWVKPFADFLGLKLISTTAEFNNEIFTGKFSSLNCNYKEKVIRIVKEIQISKFQEVYAFGDTKGDKYMLELSTHPHFRYFE